MIIIDKKKNLETSLVIATGLLVIYLIKAWKPLLLAAIIIGLTGLFLNKPASVITWIWNKVADILGKFVPKIILSMVFIVFLIPISLVSRIFRKEAMGLNKKNMVSMWINRDHDYSKDDLAKPW